MKLSKCADLSEPRLLSDVMSTSILFTGSHTHATSYEPRHEISNNVVF